MKKNLSAVLVCFIFIGCGQQKKSELAFLTPEVQKECNYVEEYYPIIYKAEIEYHLKNYQKAFDLYEEAFKMCKPANIPLLYETSKFSEVSAILGKNELAVKLLRKRIIDGYELKWLLQDPIFKDVFETKEGKELIADYEVLRNEYLESIDLDLRHEIQQMIAVDQSYVGNPLRDSIFKVNDARLVQIFEEYGYPNEKVVGNFNIDKNPANPTILLLHTSDSLRINYFIPKLQESIENGSCPPTVLGAVIDNLHLFNGELIRHAVYEDTPQIPDTEEINKNRLQIGLPTLEMQAQIDSLRRI